MIRVAVIDDEALFSGHIKQIVEAFFSTRGEACEVIVYNLPNEMLWDLEENRYFDIYLIDVEMPALNGLELAQQIRIKYEEPYIIFITCYMKYCICGYEYNAYRYISKAMIDEKLPPALSGLLGKLKQKVQFQYIIESYSKVQKINYEDIYYLYIDRKYTYFQTRSGLFRDRKPLSGVYEELKANANDFIYADKSYIINLRHVMGLGDRVIVMRDKEEIPVSIPQHQTVKKSISAYWRGKR